MTVEEFKEKFDSDIATWLEGEDDVSPEDITYDNESIKIFGKHFATFTECDTARIDNEDTVRDVVSYLVYRAAKTIIGYKEQINAMLKVDGSAK